MNRFKCVAHILTWVVPLVFFNPCWSQFQYFGMEFGSGTSAKRLTTSNVSISYLRQYSSYHGLGAEISLPHTYDTDLTYKIDWRYNTPWEGAGSWTRKVLPSVGLRYRFFASNHFFLGAVLHFGAVQEKCFADRNYVESYRGAEILPVYFDYVLASPFARLSGEMGFHWPMGKWLFGSILLRGGPQLTVSRAKTFGVITSETQSQQLDSYHGVDLYGNASIGLGVKL